MKKYILLSLLLLQVSAAFAFIGLEESTDLLRDEDWHALARQDPASYRHLRQIHQERVLRSNATFAVAYTINYMQEQQRRAQEQAPVKASEEVVDKK